MVVAVEVAWVIAGRPLVGLVSLLLRATLDPNFTNPQLHFVLFSAVGAATSLFASVVGDTVNLGSRPEGAAPVGGVLIGKGRGSPCQTTRSPTRCRTGGSRASRRKSTPSCSANS